MTTKKKGFNWRLDGYKTYIIGAVQTACGIFLMYQRQEEVGLALILNGLGQASLRSGIDKK